MTDAARPVADLLLTGGTVVAMDPERRIIPDGVVAVTGNRISAVGSARELAGLPARQRIDCTGKLVLPGLIDAHGHAGHSLIKTMASDLPTLWMRIVTPGYQHFTTRDFWAADGLLSAVDRLRHGVTCGVSVLGSVPRADDPEFGIRHARGYADVGIREVLCVGPGAPPWPNVVSRWDDGHRERREVSHEQALAGTEAVIQACDGTADGRIQVFVTPFTIVPSLNPSSPTPPELATGLTEFDREQSRRIRELAARYRVRIHSDAFGGMIRLAVKDENALLGPDVHLQHCMGLSDEEVGILADTGTNVGHAAGGPSPVTAMLQAGITVAVTTDGASRRPFDLIQAARGVQAALQLRTGDPWILPVGKLLEMITIDAARAMGLDGEIGSLEVGKKADIITVDMAQPHLTPGWMPVHRLIYQGSGSDVDTVIVDGTVLMSERRVLTVDAGEVVRNAAHESAEYLRRSGFDRFLTDPGWGRTRLEYDCAIDLPE